MTHVNLPTAGCPHNTLSKRKRTRHRVIYYDSEGVKSFNNEVERSEIDAPRCTNHLNIFKTHTKENKKKSMEKLYNDTG